MFKDALKQALGEGSELKAREPAPSPRAAVPALPGPEGSGWLTELARHEPVDAGAALGKLRQTTDLRVKALKKQGRGRDAKSLAKARDDYFKRRDKAAWGAVKARWAELQLSEKAYRRLKQAARVQPEKVLERLHTRKAQEMTGRGADALMDWLV